MKVLICGGGTGGHVYPALAAVAELRQLGLNDNDFLWIGAHGEMEESLVPRAGLTLETIAAGPVVGVRPWTAARNGARMLGSVGRAHAIIGRFRPDVLFLTGGYVNVPVALAARLRGLAAAIYLPDVEPGSAIRLLSRWVDRIACTTAESAQYLPAEKLAPTGYPVRDTIREARELSRVDALSQFDLAPGRPTLFVFGGSRGARTINRALQAALPTLLSTVQIIHISGELDWAEVADNAAALPVAERAFYRAYPYLHERMGAAFRAADLVVARAGASMLGEGPAFGLPAILVPYPFAWRYQKVNADYLAARGAAVRLDDERLAEALAPTVLGILGDDERRARMAAAAQALDRPDAARRLAELLLKLGRGKNDG